MHLFAIFNRVVHALSPLHMLDADQPWKPPGFAHYANLASLVMQYSVFDE
jgi:hypothetical protein